LSKLYIRNVQDWPKKKLNELVIGVTCESRFFASELK
jgi:hypothetical protein